MASDDDDNERTENRIDIDGDAAGPVIAGNHNLVVDAQHGSTVTVLMQGQRPRPKRHDRVRLLPRRQGVPLGRDADLESIAAALRDGSTVQLWGPPGVGKSALLRHAAHTLTGERDEMLFLDAARREPEDLAQDMFEACYEAGGYAPSRTDLCRLMAGIEMTVYVDNAEYTAEQLRTLMDAAPDAKFVFAGRESSLLGTDGTARRLHGIGRAAAMELLARELGRPVTDAAEQATAAALWETASGMPLLLLRAAAVARLDPSGEAVLPKPGRVEALLPPLFDRLDGPSLRALHLLATLDDAELAPVHIGALSETSDPSSLCEGLAELGLAQETERGYRVETDVVPALRGLGGLQPYSLERLCTYFAQWATQPTTNAAQVADHARALEVVAELAEQSGRADLAVQVVRAASPALARSLRFGVWGRLLDQGLPAAQRADDRQAQAYFTHEQGIRKFLTGNRAVAAVLLAEAAVLWRQLGDTQGADAASAAQQHVPQQAPPSDGPSVMSPQADGGAPDVSGSSGADPTPVQDVSSSGVDPTSAQSATSQGLDPTSAQSAAPSGVDPTSAHVASSPAPDLTSVQSATTPGTGMPVDPGTAASHVVGAPPPGSVDISSALASSGTGTGAAAGAASTGAVAALKVIAVIAALVIGVVAIEQNQDSTDLSTDTPAVVITSPDTESDDPDPVYTNPADTGLDETEPAETGLAGVWWSSEGGGIEFVEAGPGTYTATAKDVCGNTVTVEFTGSGDTYTATDLMYDMDGGSCGRILGEVLTTITINPDGNTAEVTKEMTSAIEDNVECYTCTPSTWTRAS
ncbi:ATP-binding protein [Streptomyces sp. NPDC058256]|uniref:ATP-binding protein n=1 Tax=Streptomyces sp. NPDC058256 TaxID=3346408 RepID=UPI0036EA3E27